MRIDTILESTLKSSQLKRVRIKVDPAQLLMQNFHMVDSYEGYILEEEGDHVRVIMLNLPDEFDPIQTVSKQHVTACDGVNDRFVSRILRQLEKEGVQQDNPHYQQIKNTHSSDFIDSYLRQLGYDDKKLIEFYRALSQEPVVEGIASDLVTKAGNLAGGLQKNPLFKGLEMGTKTLSKIPGLAVGRDNIIGRVAKFIDPKGSGFMSIDSLVKNSNNSIEKNRDTLDEGTPVFITGIPDKEGIFKTAGETDDVVYQVSGKIGRKEGENSKLPQTFKIDSLYPSSIREDFVLFLDYPVIYNPNKRGRLYVRSHTGGAFDYPVEIFDYKNRIIIKVDREAFEQELKTGKASKWAETQDTLGEQQNKVKEYVNIKLTAYIRAFKNQEMWDSKSVDAIMGLQDKIIGNILKDDKRVDSLEKSLETTIEDLMNSNVIHTSDIAKAISSLTQKLKDKGFLNK